MDLSILHTKLKDYKARAKNPLTQEIVLLFESWLTPTERYISDVELINFELDHRIDKLQETINLLCDIIIITGNADKLFAINLKDEHTKEAIMLLIKNKDRVNHQSLSAISALLYINRDQKFESLKQLKEYASRDTK